MTEELQGLLTGAGYVYHNPDTGEEYAPSHPIESGEVPEATDIRRSTGQEDHLYATYQAEWKRAETLLASLSAKDAEIAGLRAALANIFNKLDRGEGAPGHSHDVAGIWDADNAPGVAGTKCEWCAQWDAARALHQNPESKA